MSDYPAKTAIAALAFATTAASASIPRRHLDCEDARPNYSVVIQHDAPKELVVAAAEQKISERFKVLADKWQRETSGMSVVSRMLKHDAYRQILSLGDNVLRLIFVRLETHGGMWFNALHDLTGTWPPLNEDDYGRYDRLRDAWLKWGQENGFLRPARSSA